MHEASERLRDKDQEVSSAVFSEGADTYEAEEQWALKVLHLRDDESWPPLTRTRLNNRNTRTDAEEGEAGYSTGHDSPDTEGPAKPNIVEQRIEHEREHETWPRVRLSNS